MKSKKTKKAKPAKSAAGDEAKTAGVANVTRRSNEFGISRPVLVKALRAAGIEDAVLTIRQCHVALLGGDYKAARAKEAVARAELLTQQAARERGESLLLADAEAYLVRTLQPIREAVNAMPSQICARVNPADPEHARGILVEWADRVVEIGRGGK